MTNESDMKARVEAAWDEVRGFLERLQKGETTRAEDPQPALATGFFDAFLSDPQSEDGRLALRTACRMWGNAGDPAPVEAALAHLDPAEDYWAAPLRGAWRAYGKAGRREEYLTQSTSRPSHAVGARSGSGRVYRWPSSSAPPTLHPAP